MSIFFKEQRLVALLKYRRKLLFLSAALFMLSMPLPAFYFDLLRQPLKGFEVFFTGMFGILLLEPRWYANVFYLYCLTRLFLHKTAMKSAYASLLLAASSFIFPIYYYPNEAGGLLVSHLGPATYLWFVSVLIVFIISITEKNEATIRGRSS